MLTASLDSFYNSPAYLSTSGSISSVVAPFRAVVLVPSLIFSLGNLICGVLIATGVRNGFGRNFVSCAASFNVFCTIAIRLELCLNYTREQSHLTGCPSLPAP